MNYGVGATPTVAGIAIIPATGSNSTLFFIAAGLITAGVVVLAVSLVQARLSAKA